MEIFCSQCKLKEPLGTRGNGPAYAYGNSWLCERHWKELESPEHVEKVRMASGRKKINYPKERASRI